LTSIRSLRRIPRFTRNVKQRKYLYDVDVVCQEDFPVPGGHSAQDIMDVEVEKSAEGGFAGTYLWGREKTRLTAGQIVISPGVHFQRK
jgi:hypothetical protein